MKSIFKAGDKKTYKRVVQSEDLAAFHGELVHPVYSTFSLARDIEWTTRQFVIDMRDDDEEGIGTFLTIDHQSPAFDGEEVIFTGYIDKLEGNELICSVEVRSGDRLIATGRTGQKILKRDKIKRLFQKL
jgi:fluoroacetyl-CoA thioesterase